MDADTPLTLEEYLSLPGDARAEIVDGVLRPMVRPSLLHRTIQRRLANALEAAKPRELRVAEEQIIVFQHKPPTARIPDIAVFDPDADRDGVGNSTPASDVVLVVEVVSPTTATADRIEKRHEYARNHIPSYWRVELEPDIAVHVHELMNGKYQEIGVFHRDSRIIDPKLRWAKIPVEPLLGDFAEPRHKASA